MAISHSLIISQLEQVLATSHSGKDGAHDDPAVDFRGNPVDKSTTGGWLAAGLILGAYH